MDTISAWYIKCARGSHNTCPNPRRMHLSSSGEERLHPKFPRTVLLRHPSNCITRTRANLNSDSCIQDLVLPDITHTSRPQMSTESCRVRYMLIFASHVSPARTMNPLYPRCDVSFCPPLPILEFSHQIHGFLLQVANRTSVAFPLLTASGAAQNPA